MELGGPTLRTVRKVLGVNHPDAEDVAQEAVLGLLASLQRFRGECTVTHYALQVALRTALHARRRLRTHGRLCTESAAVPDTVDATQESPLDAAVSKERREVVRRLLDQLPEPTAEALALHFMLGYTVDEIAVATGVSPHTVWSRLKLGKRALKRALARDHRLAELLRGRVP